MNATPGRTVGGFEGASKLREGEIAALIKRIPENQPFRMCEIGCYGGVTSAIIAQARPECLIVAVDISPDFRSFKRNQQPNQVLVVCPSEMLPQMFPHCFDLVFIDGDHSYDGCMGDLCRADSLLRDSGRVLCHDYGIASCPEVRPAVDDFCVREGRITNKLAGSVVEIIKTRTCA